jgi:hypothetical protein
MPISPSKNKFYWGQASVLISLPFWLTNYTHSTEMSADVQMLFYTDSLVWIQIPAPRGEQALACPVCGGHICPIIKNWWHMLWNNLEDLYFLLLKQTKTCNNGKVCCWELVELLLTGKHGCHWSHVALTPTLWTLSEEDLCACAHVHVWRQMTVSRINVRLLTNSTFATASASVIDDIPRCVLRAGLWPHLGCRSAINKGVQEKDVNVSTKERDWFPEHRELQNQ